MCSKRIIIILMLAFSSNVIAQDLSYIQVDSTSYALYSQKQWVNLIEFGEMAVKNGVDYYYLNLRLGIAWYYAKDYYKSQKYFEKALKQDKSSQTANEYLFLIDLLTNKPLSADINYNNLNDSTKTRLDRRTPYYITSMYFEAGIKLPKYKNLENSEPIFRFYLDQKITRRFNLGISASYIRQYGANWGSYDQFEFGLIPTIAIGSNTILNTGWRYIYSNVKLDEVEQSNFRSTTQVQTEFGMATLIVDSTIINKDNSINLTSINAFFAGIEQYYRRFSFLGQGLVYVQNNDLKTDKTISTTVDEKIVMGNHLLSRTVKNETIKSEALSNFTNYYYQAMIGVTYTFPVLNDGLKIGLSAYIPLNDSFSKTVWIPTLNIRLSDRLWFYSEWLQKKDIPLLYQNGNIYLNQTYELYHRITLGLKLIKSDKVQWYFTYLSEEKYYPSDQTTNRFNSIIIGINIKF